ncbi:hypothetical protein [Niastella sp. OAS944]|uniref:hypothetical protein n=1 Tax=Niastella sp. OAS944 TaxID=2664089 RepID=UPI00346993A9|nr:hypothetical protein [Chitinophagaceae bacterium OAS944]
MQSDKQHIDDFFRQKEEAFRADEQHATAHWQQMQKQLANPGPGASTNNRTIKQIGRFLGALLTIAIIALLTIKINRSNKKAITRTNKQQSAVVAPPTKAATMPDTLSHISQPTNKTVHVTPTSQKKPPPEPAMTLISPPITRAEETSTQTAEYNNSELGNNSKTFETKGPKPNAQTLLNLFYDQLKKKEEAFYIDADRDNTITAKEGTILTIPAHAFINKSGVAKGKVKIIVHEYYKYEDILAAKLSTTSNDKQLVTGGMLHISAEQDGKEVKIAPQSAVAVSVPTDDYNTKMMLFKGVEQPSETDNTTLNWIPAGAFQELTFQGHNRTVQVLNLQKVEPASVNYGKKTTAKFYVSSQIDIPKSALIAALKQRFGTYYDEIKLKKLRKKKAQEPTSFDDRSSIIDSVRIDLHKAFKMRLLPKNDSLYYALLLKQDSIEHEKRIKRQKHYRFAITDLGWINCDFFSNNASPKINLTTDLGKGQDGHTCFSQLVFTKYRSVLQSYYVSGNKLRYERVPEGEAVVLVIVTVKDDTVWSCFRSLNITKSAVTDLVFEPTTPEQFKQKLQSFFAPQQQ